MKKVFIVVVSICFLIIVFTFYTSPTPEIKLYNGAKNTSAIETETVPTVNFGTYTYSYLLFRAQSPIVVIQNDMQEEFSTVSKKNKCTYAINGGFYTTENEPLGLVQVNGKVVSVRIPSTFFDGFLSIDGSNGYIGREPHSDASTIVQSGPILIENGAVVPLRIQEDKPSRRSVAIVTDTHALYFMTLFSEDSRFSGPYLSDLPMIVKEISLLEHINFDWALNLDGGSASAIKTSNVLLPEFRTVKTVICTQ